MQLGFKIILFLLILNLTTSALYTLEVPGTKYARTQVAGQLGNATAYDEKFNATDLMGSASPQIYTYLNVWDYAFNGISLLWNGVRTVIVGFPDMVNSYADLLPDPSAKNAVQTISYILYAVFSFCIFAWLLQLIINRRISE